jgi:hypothetical protein
MHKHTTQDVQTYALSFEEPSLQVCRGNICTGARRAPWNGYSCPYHMHASTAYTFRATPVQSALRWSGPGLSAEHRLIGGSVEAPLLGPQPSTSQQVATGWGKFCEAWNLCTTTETHTQEA